ncbi:hypothetical protein NX773_02185 [Massilia solisilvae]|uniref:Uncharacterized protein n=1 Tax=Massilia solisilvae TaxID=1811225 RepID=A0ABT2BEM3_9BURK|nr:hypothetical protein [Massilia solisilvae]MCS0606972.1 hypothetical protein [Massilia solisilvae]
MQTVKDQQSNVEERMTIAREQSALFPTRLALARWMSGADFPHLHHAHPPLRAAWLAQAQRDFQAWLDGGGFVQHDGAANEPKASPDGHSAETWAI